MMAKKSPDQPEKASLANPDHSSEPILESITYGTELWDCLSIIEKNNNDRIKNMQVLKEFFDALKHGLENFSSFVKQKVKQLNVSVV